MNKHILKFIPMLLLFLLPEFIKAQEIPKKRIYTSALKDLRKCEKRLISYILKKESSNDRASYSYLKSNAYKNIDSTTVKSFNTQNKQSIELDFLTCPSIVKIVSEAAYKKLKLHKRRSWKKLAKKYPKYPMVLELSNIGINDTKTQALLTYFEKGHSSMSAEGRYVILEKRENQWEVVATMNSIVY